MCGCCHNCVICKAGIHLVMHMKRRRTLEKIDELEDVKKEPEVELNVQPEVVKVKVKHKVDQFGNIVQYKVGQVEQHTDT